MKIELTDREIELMMMCIGTNIETIKQRHTIEGAVAELIEELFELETDLREALHRQDDGWGDTTEWIPRNAEPKEIAETSTFLVSEDDFIQRGIDAREQQKAASHAQTRRNERMMAGTASPVDWNPSDPTTW